MWAAGPFAAMGLWGQRSAPLRHAWPLQGTAGHGLGKGPLGGPVLPPPGMATAERGQPRLGHGDTRAEPRAGASIGLWGRPASAAPRPLLGHVHDERSHVVRVPDPERQPLRPALRSGGTHGDAGGVPPAPARPPAPPAPAGPPQRPPARGCRWRGRVSGCCPRGARCAPAWSRAGRGACTRRRSPRGTRTAPASAGTACGVVSPAHGPQTPGTQTPADPTAPQTP